jgi:hypothetical protein
MGFDEGRDKLYALAVPGQTRSSIARTQTTLYVKPPHEVADEYLDQDPSAVVRMQELVDGGDAPPS